MTTDAFKQIWPEWEIEKQLGKGSFGSVYKAVRRDHGVESYAAIKVISIPSDASEIDSLRSEGLDMNATRTYLQGIVDDFVSEIQLMESLKGVQNIVSVEDYKVVEKTGELGWEIYIRMELLTPFSTYTSDKKLTEEEVIKLGCDICTALEICGKRNIIHRDIKPANIFINDFGYFKLGDFGIARKMENMSVGLSQKGTPDFMAPEVANSREYDARVDTYSLGIVLYRLLNCNRPPFLDTEKQLLSPTERKTAWDRRIRGEQLPPPCEASPAMAEIILRACAYDPNMRFASATEMKQALISAANGTYQVGSSNFDDATSELGTPLDYDKTTSVRRAPSASNQTPAQEIHSFETTRKKKKKLPIIIASVLAFAIIVGVGIFAVPKFINNDNEDNNGTSESNVSDTADYSKFDEEQIAAIISEADSLAAEEDYEGALTKVQTALATYPKSALLKQKSDEYTQKLENQKINAILEDADKLASEKDYQGALEQIQAGLTEYPESEDLAKKSAEYTDALNEQIKSDTLAEAESLAESGDYVSAIALIKNAQKANGGDADYTNAYNTYCASYKAETIDAADELSESGDYLGASQKIAEATAVIGEDSDLSARATSYEDAYVSITVTEIEEYLEANDFSSAESSLTTALAAFPANQTLIAEKELVKNAKPQSLLAVCPPYKTNNYEEWTNLSMGGTKYPAGVSIGETWGIGGDGYALFNLSGKFKTLAFDVGNIDERGSATNQALYIYLDGRLVWSLELDPEALPTHYEVDVSGANQMKMAGTAFAGEFGITNIVITGSTKPVETTSVPSDDGNDLLTVCPPYKTENYEEWTNLSIGGTKYPAGVSIGETWGIGGDGYALFNLSGKFKTLAFDVGNIDERGSATNQALYIYLDGRLVWSLELDPEALPTHYEVDVSGANQMKMAGTAFAGEFGIFNLKIK